MTSILNFTRKFTNGLELSLITLEGRPQKNKPSEYLARYSPHFCLSKPVSEKVPFSVSKSKRKREASRSVVARLLCCWLSQLVFVEGLREIRKSS